jgi:hypothetical protein
MNCTNCGKEFECEGCAKCDYAVEKDCECDECFYEEVDDMIRNAEPIDQGIKDKMAFCGKELGKKKGFVFR